jgi:hypothetical protein
MEPSIMTQYIKDPNATLDYKVDWSAWLGADTISTSSWIVPSGITQTTASNTATTGTIWLSGGTEGRTYQITHRIVTTAGRTDDRSFLIKVAQK